MGDHDKLSLAFIGVIVADLCLIGAMYAHGNMHLIKTLTAAAEIWK